MNTNQLSDKQDPELDHFRAGLLNELGTIVDHQAASAMPSPAWPRSRRTAWIAAAVASAAAMVAVPMLASTPAYSVERQDDGDVVITFNRVNDTEGLTQELAKYGVNAKVDNNRYRLGSIGDLTPEEERKSIDNALEGSGTLATCADDRVLEVKRAGDAYTLTISGKATANEALLNLSVGEPLGSAAAGVFAYTYFWADEQGRAACFTTGFLGDGLDGTLKTS